MSHTVHIGDRSPVVITDYGVPGTPTSRTFTADEDGNVVVTAKDRDLLMSTVPTARYVDPPASPATEGDSSDSDSPSTPSGRGRGRRSS